MNPRNINVYTATKSKACKVDAKKAAVLKLIKAGHTKKYAKELLKRGER